MKNSPKIVVCLVLLCVLLISTILFLPYNNETEIKGITTQSFETEPTFNIDPELNISVFSPYRIYVDNIPEQPNNVFVEIRGISGDEGDCWDYFVDGTCGSENIVKSMERYNDGWRSNRIFPDDIYPEIYFGDSGVTWNNQPLSTAVRRNQYHILHFNNPFNMVNDMYFYIELNAYPLSTNNSTDLQVYLVEKGNNISLFNSQWMGDERVELVGTFTKDSTYHHTHTDNSRHKLIPLSTNSDGTIGSKSLNITDEFWLVIYSQSPNNNRGWNLQYHPPSLCNHQDRWYTGNMQGWSTSPTQGCPDAHIHIARRNQQNMDGVGARVTAVYDDVELISEEVEFYFGQTPNLPPSATSFTSPTVGGTYSTSLDIKWEPATDPDNDSLYYNIYLQKDSTNILSFENVASTSITIEDTTTLNDGNYALVGQVCDPTNPCVPFSLNGQFTIDNTLPIETVTSINLSTSNPSQIYSKQEDTILLTFNTSGLISTPVVEIYSGGDEVKGEIISDKEGNTWTYSFVVQVNDTQGDVTFTIISDNLDREYFETTDSSSTIIDNTPPEKPTSSLESGIYPSTSTSIVILSSVDSYGIRYSLTDIVLNCTTGDIYTTPIVITQNSVINVIACDIAGNISELSTYEYIIKEDLLSISLSTSNQNNKWAKPGDTIEILFEASNSISTPVVQLYSNSQSLNPNYTLESNENFTVWNFKYEVQSNDTNGLVSFEITSDDLYKSFTNYTQGSQITIDTISPLSPTSTSKEGIYNSPQLVSLSSVGHVFIRFTTDGTNPSCTQGLLYIYPIGISLSKTLKAVACDEAGNRSSIAEFRYLIDTTTIQFPLDEDNMQEITQQDKEDVIDETLPIETEEQQQNITTTIEESSITEEIIDTNEIILETEDNEITSDENRYFTKIIRKGTKTYISEFRVLVQNSNKETIPNLTINLYSTPLKSVTNSEGIATFTMVEVGKHTLSLDYNGRNYEREIVIEQPKVYEEEIELEVIEITLEDMEEQKDRCSLIIYIIIMSFLVGTILYKYISKKKTNKNKKEN